MHYGMIGSSYDGYHFDINHGHVLIINKSAFNEDEWEDAHILLNDMQHWAGDKSYFPAFLADAVMTGVITKDFGHKVIENTTFYTLVEIIKMAGIDYT